MTDPGRPGKGNPGGSVCVPNGFWKLDGCVLSPAGDWKGAFGLFVARLPGCNCPGWNWPGSVADWNWPGNAPVWNGPAGCPMPGWTPRGKLPGCPMAGGAWFCPGWVAVAGAL